MRGSAATNSTRASHSNPRKPPLKVEVVSLDWKWLFIYPDQDVATVNQLVVPGGHAGQFPADFGDSLERLLRAADGHDDLHHAAMTTRLNLQADRPGVYDGLSAHFSGDGFPGMEFKVHSVPPYQFAAWAQGAAGRVRRSTAAPTR